MTKKEILKELKTLSEKLKSEGHPNYHNQARSEINKKYGDDWRHKYEDYSKVNFGKMSHY